MGKIWEVKGKKGEGTARKVKQWKTSDKGNKRIGEMERRNGKGQERNVTLIV